MNDGMHYLPGREEIKRMTAEELRAAFVVPGLFRSGTLTCRLIDLDRVVLGGAVPLGQPIPLEPPDALGARFFLERREVGVLNIGKPGQVSVDGRKHELANRDLLYIGRGSREVLFESEDPDAPSRYYLVSYLAHATHPTSLISRDEAAGAEIGTRERASRRRLYRYVHADGAPSAQLVMGVTETEPGSVWNTMPPHTHHRRTEVYLYFDLPADAMVFHFLGEPEETRHVTVRDGEAVLSPGWSIHAGCGTAPYSFCWAMGGENQDFADMQPVDITTIR